MTVKSNTLAMLILAMYAAEVSEAGVERLAHVQPGAEEVSSPRLLSPKSPRSPGAFVHQSKGAVRFDKLSHGKAMKQHGRLQ